MKILCSIIVLLIVVIEIQLFTLRTSIIENRTSLTEVVQIFNGIGRLFIEEIEEADDEASN